MCAPSQLTETKYIVYRWVDEQQMTFVRNLFIRHEIGQQLTDEDVRQFVESEVHDFAPALYRAIPVDRKIDFEVKGTVVLS